ncbi:MAG: phospholipase D family protein [Sphingobacteriia bacterium]|nr:phospholipase D family protein [Sphingobacteriia bacterium]
MARRKLKTNIFFDKTNNKFFALILAIAIAIAVYLKEEKAWISTQESLGKVNVCFTPPSGCGKLIVDIINHAHNTIYIQAYSFTSKEIFTALDRATKRGVKVQLLLDKSQILAPYSIYKYALQTSIDVSIDERIRGIAHNKIIIVDDLYVITGSYNFTSGAEKRNAENVILIKDEKIANSYKENWFLRKVHSLNSN